MSCTHQIKRQVWVEVECWSTGEMVGHWEETTESTTEDIDTGRFKCYVCGEVFYYTGLWRDYFEKGIPCPGSDRLK
jgi:hypothetical protein